MLFHATVFVCFFFLFCLPLVSFLLYIPFSSKFMHAWIALVLFHFLFAKNTNDNIENSFFFCLQSTFQFQLVRVPLLQKTNALNHLFKLCTTKKSENACVNTKSIGNTLALAGPCLTVAHKKSSPLYKLFV